MTGSKPQSPAPRRLIKGDIVRVVWRDALEGSGWQEILNLGKSQIRDITSCAISTVGRYLKVANGYLILDEVFQEKSNEGQVVYEKQAAGKWMAIPVGAIIQASQAGEVVSAFSNGIKRRRRTIMKQLRFLSRIKRLPNGKLSRTLYLT